MVRAENLCGAHDPRPTQVIKRNSPASNIGQFTGQRSQVSITGHRLQFKVASCTVRDPTLFQPAHAWTVSGLSGRRESQSTLRDDCWKLSSNQELVTVTKYARRQSRSSRLHLPHTSHLTPHTSHLEPHTHLIPHNRRRCQHNNGNHRTTTLTSQKRVVCHCTLHSARTVIRRVDVLQAQKAS